MNEEVLIGFAKLSDDATIPTKAHKTDSGYDLYSAEDVIIFPGETKVVKTNIAVSLPEGYEAQVRPRSGVTSKTNLRVQLGTIDNGYTGDIGIIVDSLYSERWVKTAPAPCHFLVESYIHTIAGEKEAYPGVIQAGAYKIRKGDRLAQLVIQKLPKTYATEISVDTLDDSQRGSNGFGSTGVVTEEMSQALNRVYNKGRSYEP